MNDTAIAGDLAHVRAFYDRHPISAPDILARIKEQRGSLDRLKPEELFPHDQDHYGGIAANDALAGAARIRADDLVLDLCCGLGGPARYLALTRRCRVIGLDRHPGRIRGAVDLTRRVNLARRTRFLCGDAAALPFAGETFDAVLSQEALLHVPDKGKALGEVFRALKPGGQFVFTDWIAGPALTPEERAAMWQGIAAQSLQTINQYLALLRAAGFADIRVVNLSALWVPILKERLAMYRRLREETCIRTGIDSHADYCAFYEAFVDLVERGALGGARFAGMKPGARLFRTRRRAEHAAAPGPSEPPAP
ncbi:MAG: methyltransferase domain-containing protein [Rhodospirillaceae bacterium]|nr:methyltransferase domain-containing protein [Rhodospirillaceae bacterium]